MALMAVFKTGRRDRNNSGTKREGMRGLLLLMLVMVFVVGKVSILSMKDGSFEDEDNAWTKIDRYGKRNLFK